MVRLMSCAMTVPQVEQRIKTVTRRKGWAGAIGGPGSPLRPGDLVQLVDKVRVPARNMRRLAKVRVVAVTREMLGELTAREVELEGFPGMPVDDFVARFFEPQGVELMDLVTRVEWVYLDDDQGVPS